MNDSSHSNERLVCTDDLDAIAVNCEEVWSQENASASNNSLSHDNPYYFYETEQFALLSILFVFIVLGNSAVVAALMLSKSRKSRTNFFIMHLALADLSVGLVSVLTDILWKMTVSWNAGNAACKLVRFAQGLVTYSSTYVLVALSIDRCDAITHPMKFSGSWSRARNLVRLAWLLSLLLASPSLFLFKEEQVQGVSQCWLELKKNWHWQVYMLLVSFAVLIIPTCVITACYLIIVHTIWSKSNVMTIEQHTSKLQNGHRVDDDTRRASSRGLIPAAKIKTVKMTFVIVFVFVLCWSPYIVFDLLQVFGHIPHTQTNIAIATFIQSLAPLNSAANPIIYCLFSTRTCRTLRCTKRQLTSRNQWQKSATEQTSMSEVSSRRLQHPSVHIRSTSIRQAVAVCKGNPHIRQSAQAIDVEMLTSSDVQYHTALLPNNRCSAV